MTKRVFYHPWICDRLYEDPVDAIDESFGELMSCHMDRGGSVESYAEHVCRGGPVRIESWQRCPEEDLEYTEEELVVELRKVRQKWPWNPEVP